MIRIDTKRFERDMRAMPGVVRRATAYALTDTAKDVHAESKKRMSDAFDRPSRWTLNSLMAVFARASDADPFAEIKQKPSSEGRHYLSIEESGGDRPQTGVERLLSRLLRGSSRIGSITPAGGARLDKQGNWSRGQRSQALEALKRSRGASTGSTATSRAAFFFAGSSSVLSHGIYSRLQGGKIKKIAHVSDRSPRYRPLLGLYARAELTFARNFPDHFTRVFERLKSMK